MITSISTIQTTLTEQFPQNKFSVICGENPTINHATEQFQNVVHFKSSGDAYCKWILLHFRSFIFWWSWQLKFSVFNEKVWCQAAALYSWKNASKYRSKHSIYIFLPTTQIWFCHYSIFVCLFVCLFNLILSRAKI